MSDVITPERQDAAIAEALARTAEIAVYCADNAAAIDRNGAFPQREFELIVQAGLLAAPLGHALEKSGISS